MNNRVCRVLRHFGWKRARARMRDDFWEYYCPFCGEVRVRFDLPEIDAQVQKLKVAQLYQAMHERGDVVDAELVFVAELEPDIEKLRSR